MLTAALTGNGVKTRNLCVRDAHSAYRMADAHAGGARICRQVWPTSHGGRNAGADSLMSVKLNHRARHRRNSSIREAH